MVLNIHKDNNFYKQFQLLNNLPHVLFIANYDEILAQQELEKFFKEIEKLDYIPANIYGLSGIGIALRYLATNDSFIEVYKDFELNYSDLIFHDHLKMINNNNYDTFEGYISIINYFIFSNNKQAVDNLLKFFFDLANKLIDTNTISDLGLAHGLSGIISCLCKALLFLNNYNNKYYINSLNNFINFLQENKKQQNNGLLYPNTKDSNNSRLAWCYGDLSVAIAYTWYYKVTNNSNILSEIKLIIDNIIKLDLESVGVFKNIEKDYYDLGLCHGISGIILIIKRINLILKCDKVNSYIIKLDFLVKDTIKKIGINNVEFPYSQNNGVVNWHKNTTFLEGTIGVYFMLYDDELPKGWDCFMLTDLYV